VENKTRKLTWLLFLPLLVAAVSLWLAEGTSAQDGSIDARGVDIVVVLDDSGSMATCWPWAGPVRTEACFDTQNPPSDPNDLRYSAARLLVMLAADEDRVAVVRFNANTENVIGQLEPLGSPNKRQSLIEAIRAPADLATYEATGGYTRIDLGLNHAQRILDTTANTNRTGYVLLLTDGVPTQPGEVPRQDQAIQDTIAALAQQGVQVFPVLLCNEKAGCPDDAFVRRTMGKVPAKAATADDLLQVFSDIFSQMKPDLHVLDRRNSAGELEITTRPAHGTQRLVIVGKKDELVALKRDGLPETVSRAFGDDNILVNIVDGDKLAEGTWTVQTRGRSSFIVAQTETYPELVYPPPAVPGSAAAPHYVPAGKPVIVVAKINGPGGDEPLLLDGTTPLAPLATDSQLRWTVLPGGTDRFTLQVGEDTQPLQIRRQFNLETRTDLPVALVLSPSSAAPCLSSEPCELKAAFGPGTEIQEVQGVVYATDESAGGKLVYSAPMTCSGRECLDPAQDFKRLDGHTYSVRFLLQARSGDAMFGDWAETSLTMEPAVYLRGLPTPLNLKAQPPDGWPVTVSVGTIEDLGQLRASIFLTRTEDNTPVPDAEVSFGADLRSAGEQAARLLINVPEKMRPGRYLGEITFSTDNPGENGKVRLPEPVTVSLNLARPAATVSTTAVDFGSTIFDTSPNFRVNQTAFVDVQFSETSFNLIPAIADSTCPGLKLEAGEPQAQGNGYRVPITLRSVAPIPPQTCSGTLTLRGPSDDYVVQPDTSIAWRFVIPQVEWEILGVEQNGNQSQGVTFGRLGKPGERSDAVLLVRYSGRPPFDVELAAVQGTDENRLAILDRDNIALVPAPVTPQPNQQNVYRVPITLMVERSLPYTNATARWLLGTSYSGKLQLSIVGLPGSSPQEINFRLHNPGWYQRYIQPFYRWWWPGLLTCPLSLLIPLVLLTLVWIRRKDADVERLMAAKQQEMLAEEAGPALELATEGPPLAASGPRSRSRDASSPEQRYPIPRRPVRPAKAPKRAGLAGKSIIGASRQGRENTGAASPDQAVPVPARRPPKLRPHKPNQTRND